MNTEIFVFNENENITDEGSKWTVKGLMQRLEQDGVDTKLLWRRISDVIVKSILSSYGPLLSASKSVQASSGSSSSPSSSSFNVGIGGNCFQFLGFDILVMQGGGDPSTPNQQLPPPRPMLVEINRNCSLRCETPLDRMIKVKAIKQTLQIIDPHKQTTTTMKEEEGMDETAKIASAQLAKQQRAALRGLSGKEYKEAIAARKKAAVTAQIAAEDAILAEFGGEGGFYRLYPLPTPSTNNVTNPRAIPPLHPAFASLPESELASYFANRTAVYDRLMSLSLKVHSDSQSSSSASTLMNRRRLLASSRATRMARVQANKKNGTADAQ